MSNLSEKFTENAEQFDALMVEMLAENDRLKEAAKQLEPLRAIGKLICDQDNRHTDQPMFLVQEEVEVGPIEEGYGGYSQWFDHNNCELASDHMAKRLDQREEAGGDDEYKDYRKHWMKKEWVFVTACFTEQGCKDYLEKNGHNHGNTRIYAGGSFRNKEYQTVRGALIALTGGAK